MLKSLGGSSNDYFYLHWQAANESQEKIRRRKFGAGNEHGSGMVLSAKMYQDVSCRAVKDKYGVDRCTECPLETCEVTDKEVSHQGIRHVG